MAGIAARPQSCVSWFDPILMAAVIAITCALFWYERISDEALFLTILGALMLVMVPREYLRSPARALPRPPVAFMDLLRRSLIKWMGIMAPLSLVLLIWAVAPFYNKAFCAPFFEMGQWILPWLPATIGLVIVITEWRLGPEQDHAWHFGLLWAGRFKEIDWAIVRTGAFAWVVRGFFLPLNIVDVMNNLHAVRGRTNLFDSLPWTGQVALSTQIIYTALLVAIIPGYLFGARLLGTGFRRVDYSVLGWLATLMCYAPLSNILKGHGFDFRTNGTEPWILHFGATGTSSYVAGSALILCMIIHYWGESICGLRSAHLSSRGIITNGPFSLTKHPVYVIKCIGWGLMFLPFLNTPFHTLLFIATGFVYGARAWVEERVLSSDPVYVAYGRWMDDHSVFRFMGRALPVLSYEWRHARWLKNGALNG